MKITVAAKELVRALKASQNEKNSTIPILAFARIVATAAGAIAISATDLDLYTVVDVAGEVIEPGDGLIPYRRTLDVLQGETGSVELTVNNGVKGQPPSYYVLKNKDENVEISRHPTQAEADQARLALLSEIPPDGKRPWLAVVDGDDVVIAVSPWVSVRISGCEFKLYGGALSNYPSFEKLGFDKAKPVLTVPAAQLSRALDRVAFAISQEESRYTLNGLLIAVARDHVQLVATDGHRLSAYRLLGEYTGEGKARRKAKDTAPAKYLVRSAAVTWLRSHINEKSTGNVSLQITEDVLHFTLEGKRLSALKLTGNFPNYEAVLPREDSQRYRATILDSAALVKTLGRIVKVADERSGAIKVRVNGTLTLAAESTDTGSALATIPAVIEKFDAQGEPLIDDEAEVAIGFNSAYLADFLKLAGKGASTLAIRDAQSAGWLTAPVGDRERWQYVIMPMRI